MQHTPTVVLAIAGLLFAAIGTAHLFDPAGTIAPTGIRLSAIASFNEIRANYGGMHLVLGLYFLAGAISAALRPQALLLLALFCIGLVLGRSVSLVLDGSPGMVMNSFLLIEIVGAAAAMVCWRRTLHDSWPDRQAR